MTLTSTAMAASSSLSNFLSFILPTKPPPSKTPPPSQLNFPSPSPPSSPRLPSQTYHKLPDNLAPLVLEDDGKHNSCLSAELSSVICPSLAYSNTLFCKPFNVEILVEEDEPEERLLNRFRREVMKSGIIQECKRRRFFENKQDEKKRKSREAAKRNRRRPRPRFSSESKPEVPRAIRKEEDDDNWDLPEEDVPY